LTITDPLGQQEMMVYRVQAEETTINYDMEAPAGIMYSKPNLLHYRNTFYWDRNAMSLMPDRANPDYNKARILHWLHLAGANEIAAGILESEKEPLERRVWYNYLNQADGQGKVDSTTSPSERQVSSRGVPSKIGRILEDGTSQLYQFEYNDLGRITRATDPLGRQTTFNYDPANLIDLIEIRQTTPGFSEQLLGKLSYNSKHLPETVQDASGQITQYRYTTFGQPDQITSPKGEITTLHYNDASGFLEWVLLPEVPGAGLTTAQRTITYNPDTFLRVGSVVADGYTLAFEYDHLDRTKKVTYPDTSTEEVVYNRLDPALVKDRVGRWSAMEYDPLQRVVVTRDPQGGTTLYNYCQCGALSSITDPKGQITSWIRDLEGRVAAKVFPDGSKTQYTYESASGRLYQMTDAKGQTTTYSYYLDNNLKQVTYSGNVPTPTVTFTYDPQFNRLRFMDDGNGRTEYSYKPIMSLSSPPTTAELASAKGAGKLQTVDGPLSNDTVSYEYDEMGRTVSRGMLGDTESRTFDALGRVTSVNNPLDTFAYTYENASGRLKTINRQTGKILDQTYFPAIQDRNLQTIINTRPNGTTLSRFDYSYTVDGQVTTWNRSQGSTDSSYYGFTYDAIGQLLTAKLMSQTPGVPDSLVKEFGYTYDGLGNRLSDYQSSPTPSTTTSKYNNLNQLKQHSAGERVQFQGTATDPSAPVTVTVGGLPAATSGSTFSGAAIASPDSPIVGIVARDSAGNSRTNRYQVRNIATAGTAKSFTYDLNGNVIAAISGDTLETYEWDAANRLIALDRIVGANLASRSEFTYDGYGSRTRVVEKDGNGNVISDKRYVWSGTDLWQERNSAGTTVTKKFFAQGEIIGTAKYFFTRDHLGSIREVFDANGTLAARYDYDPFGARTLVNGAFQCDFGFTGHFHHGPSGLALTFFRVYDPSAGRWLSRDPIEETGGLNLYGYVGNNPINAIDPIGLSDRVLQYDLTHDGLAPFRVARVNGLNALVNDAEKQLGPGDRISVLRIGGHGYPGAIHDGVQNGVLITENTFQYYRNALKNPDLLALGTVKQSYDAVMALRKLASLMAQGGKVDFIACSAFKDEAGRKLLRELESIFGEGNVHGYAFPVKWGLLGDVYGVVEKDINGQGYTIGKFPLPR
jgi:RHS repeat-associated protein